jgi:2'-5' RNA ligase
MVRCFVGFLLPEEIKNKIVELQEKMEKWPMKCKFVEKENLHLCFSFLGEIDNSKIKEISNKLDLIGKGLKKIEVNIEGLAAIPNQNYIRVIALKILENDLLNKVFEEIKKEIGGDSKPAHITLCRVKSVENKSEVRRKIEDEKISGKFLIEAIQLIKSELKKTGPVYSVIHQAELS